MLTHIISEFEDLGTQLKNHANKFEYEIERRNEIRKDRAWKNGELFLYMDALWDDFWDCEYDN